MKNHHDCRQSTTCLVLERWSQQTPPKREPRTSSTGESIVSIVISVIVIVINKKRTNKKSNTYNGWEPFQPSVVVQFLLEGAIAHVHKMICLFGIFWQSSCKLDHSVARLGFFFIKIPSFTFLWTINQTNFDSLLEPINLQSYCVLVKRTLKLPKWL